MPLSPEDYLSQLVERYPVLEPCRADIDSAYQLIAKSYTDDGKLLIAGNGGSAADADHIVGELMKGFASKRPLPKLICDALKQGDSERGANLARNLQGSLPAIALTAQSSIITAVLNDIGSDYIFAQQVMGYGHAGDVLLLITTSGNSEDLLCAAVAARVSAVKIIALTGENGGKLLGKCDVHIRVPGNVTEHIQELHLPVYHCLCLMLEARFFPA